MDVKKKFIFGSLYFFISSCLIMTHASAAEKKENKKKEKTKEEITDPKEIIKEAPSSQASYKIVAIPKSASFKLPELPPKVPTVSKYPDPSIVEVQKQLADIVKIQQSLQLQQNQQISEIQKIVEQAQAHQKLLGELEKAKENIANESQVDEAIRRQKIQLIEEQAAKNKAALEKLKEKEYSEEKSTSEELTTVFGEAPSEIDEVSGPSLPPMPAPKKSEEKPKKSSWWWNSGK